MALRRKDIKKSSYYVWFLGAKESKGIRGKDYLLPVISHLVDREKEVEPFKVTLQISQKGLKIIQNVLSTHPKTSKPKNETIKHFIPHNTITCVYQDEDIVACILLLYNPVTKCPLHVHVYRCDSSETAGMLRSQLEILIERPENQKKYGELELRFGKKKVDSSVGSDTGTSSHSSTSIPSLPPSHPLSSPPLSPPSTSQVLRASLAAELRARLGGGGPLLLPPKDYDTEAEHALVGRERERELRERELRERELRERELREREHRERDHREHRESLSRGEISLTGGGRELRDNTGGGLMATMLTGKERDKRLGKTGSASSGIGSDAASPRSPSGSEQDSRSDSDDDWNLENTESSIYLMHGSEMILPRASRHPDSSKFSPEPPKSPSYDSRHSRYPDRYRDDIKYEKKDLKYPEKYPEHYPEKYPEKYDKRYDSRYDNSRRIDDRYYEDRYDNRKFEKNRRYDDFDEDYRQSPRYYDENRRRSKYYAEYPEYQESKIFFDESRRKAENRQRSPTPEVNISPKDRFKDAKEKFLLLERERIEEERIRRQEMHNSIPNLKDKSFLRRHDSISHIKDERHPRPAPRQHIDDEKYRHEPLERYRNDKHRPYTKLENEHKLKSNEIAKELKRRSYLDNNYDFQQDAYLDNFSKSNIELDKMAKSKKNAGYRHSYAEPKLSLEKMGKKYPEVVHRTNSSVSNSGRVGLASVNPY